MGGVDWVLKKEKIIWFVLMVAMCHIWYVQRTVIIVTRKTDVNGGVEIDCVRPNHRRLTQSGPAADQRIPQYKKVMKCITK